MSCRLLQTIFHVIFVWISTTILVRSIHCEPSKLLFLHFKNNFCHLKLQRLTQSFSLFCWNHSSKTILLILTEHWAKHPWVVGAWHFKSAVNMTKCHCNWNIVLSPCLIWNIRPLYSQMTSVNWKVIGLGNRGRNFQSGVIRANYNYSENKMYILSTLEDPGPSYWT